MVSPYGFSPDRLSARDRAFAKVAAHDPADLWARTGPHPRLTTEAETCRIEAAAWGGPPVHPLEWGAPVRTGTPRAGDEGYEPGECPVPRQVRKARTKLVIAVLLVCVGVLVIGVIAAVRWRVGATW